MRSYRYTVLHEFLPLMADWFLPTLLRAYTLKLLSLIFLILLWFNLVLGRSRVASPESASEIFLPTPHPWLERGVLVGLRRMWLVIRVYSRIGCLRNCR